MATKVKITRNKLKKRRFYKRKGFWAGFLVVSLVLCVAGYFAFDYLSRPYRLQAEAYDLEHINDLEVPSVILDRNNQEIGRIYVQNRSIIPLSKVPKIFIDALRAGEDQRFRDHHGVDYIGIVRGFYLNARSGRETQGASTLTQQLARNAYPLKEDIKHNGQSKYERKLVEIFLAQRIEKRYTKDQILEFYLNRICFGSGFYGIRSASLGYFGKEPADLTASESASIVGAIKNPTAFSPLNSLEANKKSRNLVLGRMPDLGDSISRDEANRLAQEPVVVHPKPLSRGVSHLYERISDEMRSHLGDDAFAAGGFTVYTSIDGKVQKAMEEAIEQSCRKAEETPGYANPKRSAYRKTETSFPEYLQGAGLMVDHGTGEILAYIGGRSYVDAPFDVIESGRRPLGTAFFPFLYAAGLNQPNINPGTILNDERMDMHNLMVGGLVGTVGEYGTEVARPRSEHSITLRRGLEASKIAASVGLANNIGLDKVAATGSAFGFPMDRAERLPRLAVGWESASMKEAVRAISAFARGGYTSPKKLTIVDRVTDPEGRELFRREPRTAERLHPIDDAVAYQIHDMMRGGMERGSAAGLTEALIEKPFTGAGKTGTTHDFSDNWFLGYNGRVTCGVWLGFLQPGRSIYDGAFSRDLAMPVWIAGMNAAAPSFSGKIISQPSSVEEVSICRVSGQRATPQCEEPYQDPATGRYRTRPSVQNEFFRTGTAVNIPFCQKHSGALAEIPLPEAPVHIDTTPVRSKAPALLGDDPYHTEQSVADAHVRTYSHSSALESFDDSDNAARPIELPWPGRLKIDPASE